jgi:hypothetical protein
MMSAMNRYFDREQQHNGTVTGSIQGVAQQYVFVVTYLCLTEPARPKGAALT